MPPWNYGDTASIQFESGLGHGVCNNLGTAQCGVFVIKLAQGLGDSHLRAELPDDRHTIGGNC